MPLPNSSIGQWRMVVIVTGYTLFVPSHSCLQTNVLAKFDDAACILFHTLSLLVVVKYATVIIVMNIN